MLAEDRALAAACAARLQGQMQLAWLALVFTALAVVALLLDDPGWPWWCGVILLGLVERYVAVRLRLDAALFAWLARPGTELEHLDAAFLALGFRGKAGRPLADRVRGTQDWLRRHVLLCTAQLVLAACAFATGG